MSGQAAGRRPNFLHIGPGKAGSTWVFEVLSHHPEVYLSEAKDLYYFSRCYERGPDWYTAQFAAATDRHTVLGEVSPDYLSHPEAAKRIYDELGPDIVLMLTLRDPVDRAFSSHLYLGRHGLAGATFRETLETVPEVLDEGRYGTHIGRYADIFGHTQLHVAMFDDLGRDPQRFLDDLTERLGIARLPLTDRMREPVLPASAARWPALAGLARRSAEVVRRRGGAALVGRVKSRPAVQRALYRRLGRHRPAPSAEDVALVRSRLVDDIATAEELLGVPLRRRWGWQ